MRKQTLVPLHAFSCARLSYPEGGLVAGEGLKGEALHSTARTEADACMHVKKKNIGWGRRVFSRRRRDCRLAQCRKHDDGGQARDSCRLRLSSVQKGARRHALENWGTPLHC